MDSDVVTTEKLLEDKRQNQKYLILRVLLFSIVVNNNVPLVTSDFGCFEMIADLRWRSTPETHQSSGS